MLTPLAYGLGTLVALWAFSGGEVATFWQRQIWLAIALLVLGVNVVVLQKRARIFRTNSGSLMLGAGSALLTALPVVIFIWLGKHLSVESLPMLKRSVELFQPPGFLAVLVGAVLLSAGHEIVSRGVLAPAWGFTGVAFLDALAIGFGLQNFVIFLLYWGMGCVWGLLSRQFGFMTALFSHVLWSLIVLSAALFL